MSRTCTVCAHPKRGEIEGALVSAGASYRDIAGRFDLSKSAVERHREGHLPTRLLKAQGAQELSDADRVAGELEAVKADVRRLAQKAEEEGDIRTALTGCDRALKALELQAKLAQLINEAPQVNVINAPQFLEVQAVIVGALDPYPEARAAVVRAIKGVEANG